MFLDDEACVVTPLTTTARPILCNGAHIPAVSCVSRVLSLVLARVCWSGTRRAPGKPPSRQCPSRHFDTSLGSATTVAVSLMTRVGVSRLAVSTCVLGTAHAYPCTLLLTCLLMLLSAAFPLVCVFGLGPADRRCLMSILRSLYSIDIHTPGRSMSASGAWTTPPAECTQCVFVWGQGGVGWGGPELTRPVEFPGPVAART
jgi:hypothetical protein